ncbi:arylsulfatase [Flavihumibacter profundi]|uniref:arylsulfatase n=1 Tax=Flavihumibacter profundi TaxID=2716883 RepID=UPI001CC477D7|nr:arylsulfatase [Flavihumibacter profundi]MBZ5856088.1 arylsulfatase [Flavihumibacter profundi]
MNKLLFIIFGGFWLQPGFAQLPNSKPNIVFILADDLGYGDISVNGQQKFLTPNIDRLAFNGLNFTQFYSGATVCAPSRSALLTGLHTGHTYIRGNKAAFPEGEEPLAGDIITLPEILKKAGYITGAFGKWGLGPVGTEGDPNKQGIDHFFGYNSQGLAHRYYPDHLWDNQQKIELQENEGFKKTITYAPDLIQEKALSFIAKQSNRQPFFLFLPYILPHAELLVPDDSIFHTYKGRFPEKPFTGKDYGANAIDDGYSSQPYPHASFAAMVSRLDLYVGQVVAALKARGLDKNTLIIFTSDNGPHIEGGADPDFFNSNGIYSGTKRDLYEGGIHVPFIASWPGVIKQGGSTDFVGAFWDILPTSVALAKSKFSGPTDGVSLLPVLTGSGKQQKHDFLYWEFHEQDGKQALRQQNWKAVKLNVDSLPNGPVELYDLANDPGEVNNLAAKFPEKVTELNQLMDKAHRPSLLFPFKYEKKQ